MLTSKVKIYGGHLHNWGVIQECKDIADLNSVSLL
jgi:hypothetical protein